MIKTIIFDLSEVLLQGLLGIEFYLNENHGLKVDNTVWKIQELTKLFHGEISEEEYWKAVIAKYNWPITVDELKHAVRENFREIEGTRDIIKNLKRNGYKLGLLSVHAKEWIVYCEEKYGYHKLFDSVMYSFEVAVSKPDKQAFKLILDKLRVKPKECLFVDDSLPNIESASSLGMQTIQYQNHEQFKKELIDHKINIE